MKKIIFIFCCLVLAMSMTACSSDAENPNEPKPQTETKEPEKKPEEKTPEPAKEVKAITPTGGLGDDLATFEKNYGANQGDQTMGRFKDDYILPMFADGKALNIKLQFSQTNQKTRNKKEVLDEIKNMIPTDSKKVKEYRDTIDPEREIIVYKSKILAETFGADSFMGSDPGTFIAILRKSESGGYSAVTLGLGENP